MNVTLIILSHNNIQYLPRCLAFYKELGFKGEIFIADSSREIVQEQIRQKVASFCDKTFNPSLFFYDTTTESNQKIITTLEKVVTPYVKLAGVDDFYSLQMLEEGISFLENNRDYALTFGYIYGFTHSENKTEWLYMADCYYHRSFEQNNPLDRVYAFFKGGFITVYYALFRTHVLKIIMQKATSLVDDPWHIYHENMIVLLALLQGKARLLKFPESWREMRADSNGSIHSAGWLTDKNADFYWNAMQQGLAHCMQEWLLIDSKRAQEESVTIINQYDNYKRDWLLQADRSKQCIITFENPYNNYPKKLLKLVLPHFIRKKLIRLYEYAIFFLEDLKKELLYKRYLLINKKSPYGIECLLVKQLVESSNIDAIHIGFKSRKMRRQL